MVTFLWPALKKVDIRIAMEQRKTQVAQEVAESFNPNFIIFIFTTFNG